MHTPTTAGQVIQMIRAHYPEAQLYARAPWCARIPSDAAQQLLAHLMANPNFAIGQAEYDGTWEVADQAGGAITHMGGNIRHWPAT